MQHYFVHVWMNNDVQVADLPSLDLQQSRNIRDYYLELMQQSDSLGTGAQEQWQKVLHSRMEWVQNRHAAGDSVHPVNVQVF